MTLSAFARISDASPATWRWKALICGAFVLAVWGAKLWIISRFGSSTPVNEEWDALLRAEPYLGIAGALLMLLLIAWRLLAGLHIANVTARTG
jgi:hypothetical protein